MMFFWAVLGIALIAVVVWAAVRAGSPLAGQTPRESADDILRARYARGEITREQFAQMREDLRR